MHARRIRLFVIRLIITITILSCEKPFTFSPYEAFVEEEYRDTTQKNLIRIDSLNASDSRPFKVAMIADSHYHHEDLYDALMHINAQSDIEFIIVPGDIAESGL